MIYLLLAFTAGITVYGVVYHPLASESTLISHTVISLITAAVTGVLGYGAGRITEKRIMNGGKNAGTAVNNAVEVRGDKADTDDSVREP